MHKVPCLASFALLLMVSSVIAEHPPESQSSKTPRRQVNSAGDHNPDSGRDSKGGEQTTPAIGPDLLCDALVSSAQANGLPITFFSNLIWQESRFVAHAVSRAGALGIAQFMPATAAAVGLKNPLDPLQALPASARLLGNLNRKFGNLGLAAAAYNAGDKRVSTWLAKGGELPKETRDYVLTITGVPVEQWSPSNAGSNTFAVAKRIPCREFHTFVTAAANEGATLAEGSAATASTTGSAAFRRRPDPLHKIAALREPRLGSRASIHLLATSTGKTSTQKPLHVAELSAVPEHKGKADHFTKQKKLIRHS